MPLNSGFPEKLPGYILRHWGKAGQGEWHPAARGVLEALPDPFLSHTINQDGIDASQAYGEMPTNAKIPWLRIASV